MSSREIVLWIDERWYSALNRHLKNETLEKHMEDVLDELCNQLPPREYERISREIWQEDQENRQAREASRRFAVFHVTENGESVYFSVEGSPEMLQVANHLREYLYDENAVSKFVSASPRCEKVTQEQFNAAVAERMETTGRVTGAYELSFNEKTFAVLDSVAGWETFGMKDVSSAAYSAMRKARMETADRTNIFLSKLDSKELSASDRLTMRNFWFSDTIEVVDDNKLNFYLVPDFSVDKAFGTSVEAEDSIYTVNLYANYDMVRQRVCDELEIVIYGGDEDKEIRHPLNAVDRAVLLKKMEDYCMEKEHISLEQFCKELLQVDQEQPQEDERQIAVFHVTENGESVCFSVAESLELIQTAVHLRNYLSDEKAGTKFISAFPHSEKITQEQFDAAVAERMENTGRVAGAYELDFDVRTFSALNIMDGWKVYAMQDMAAAAEAAFQETEMSEDDRWRVFLDRLEDKEMTYEPPAQEMRL